jgi:hypothetical protein
MKKLWLVLFVLLVLSGCQTKREPNYRMLKDVKYIEVDEHRFESEDQWMVISDIDGGYQIEYSISSVITEVKDNIITVHGDTCSFIRQPSGLFQTDCDEPTKNELMTYIPSTTLQQGAIIPSEGLDSSIITYIVALIFIAILAVIMGLLGFNKAVLDSYFELKAMFKLKYRDRPEYADWYKNQQMRVFRAFFVITIIVWVIVLIFMING